MILDASTEGTMMSKSAKEEIVIIDSIAASDYQVTMIGLQFKGKV